MLPVTTYSSHVIQSLPAYLRKPATDSLAGKKLSSVLPQAFWDRLQRELYPTSTSRYRFKSSTTSIDPEVIFNIAFRYAPKRIIAAAETETRTKFYPLWKRVTYIHLPSIKGGVLRSRIFRIALFALSVFFAARATEVAYEAIVPFAKVPSQAVATFTARAIPFVINYTPTKVIRAFNFALDACWRLNQFRIPLFLGTLIVLRGPVIPYVTPMVRFFNDVSVYLLLGVQALPSFASEVSYEAGGFIWNGSYKLGQGFQFLAESGEAARLAVCKERARELWMLHQRQA